MTMMSGCVFFEPEGRHLASRWLGPAGRASWAVKDSRMSGPVGGDAADAPTTLAM